MDLDAEIVAFGRRHFNVGMPNLEVVIGDAFEFVAGCTRRFDFIAVDLFVGHTFHRGVLAKPFLRRLRSLAAPGGEIAINLFKDRRSQVHVHRIQRILPVRAVQHLPRNVVVHCTALPAGAASA